MNAPTIIVLAIIAVIVGLAVWSMYRSRKKEAPAAAAALPAGLHGLLPVSAGRGETTVIL